MSKVLFAAVSLLTLSFIAPALAAEAAPCEDMVPKLNDAIKAAQAMTPSKVSPADMTKVAELKKSGLDKCKNEKDAEADTDFLSAMKLLGAKI